MPDIEQLRNSLIELANSGPLAVRQDAALMLETIGQHFAPAPPRDSLAPPVLPVQPAAPIGGSWMGAAGPVLEVEAETAPPGTQQTAPRRKVSEMLPLPRMIVDAGVSVDKLVQLIERDGNVLMGEYVATMAGVKKGNPLGDNLHAIAQRLVGWYVALRRGAGIPDQQ